VVGNQVSRTKCYSPPPQASYHSRARLYDGAINAGRAPACRYERRPYYNERGEVIYAPTQVCG
jgi:hypothetical protein